jgi:hypothetical protein
VRRCKAESRNDVMCLIFRRWQLGCRELVVVKTLCARSSSNYVSGPDSLRHLRRAATTYPSEKPDTCYSQTYTFSLAAGRSTAARAETATGRARGLGMHRALPYCVLSASSCDFGRQHPCGRKQLEYGVLRKVATKYISCEQR